MGVGIVEEMAGTRTTKGIIRCDSTAPSQKPQPITLHHQLLLLANETILVPQQPVPVNKTLRYRAVICLLRTSNPNTARGFSK